MKKLLIAVIALFTLCIAFANSTLTYAEGNETNEDSAVVQLSASKLSYYVVKLPVSVDVTDTMTMFDIYVKGDVDETKKVEVKEDKGTEENEVHYLVNNANPSIKYELTIENDDGLLGSLIQEDYNDDAKIGFTIYHDNLKAGDYSCELPLTIGITD